MFSFVDIDIQALSLKIEDFSEHFTDSMDLVKPIWELQRIQLPVAETSKEDILYNVRIVLTDSIGKITGEKRAREIILNNHSKELNSILDDILYLTIKCQDNSISPIFNYPKSLYRYLKDSKKSGEKRPSYINTRKKRS